MNRCYLLAFAAHTGARRPRAPHCVHILHVHTARRPYITRRPRPQPPFPIRRVPSRLRLPEIHRPSAHGLLHRLHQVLQWHECAHFWPLQDERQDLDQYTGGWGRLQLQYIGIVKAS